MHKKLTDRQYEEILYDVLRDLGGTKLKSAVHEFVMLLANDHKLTHADHIITEFVRIVKKKEGVVELTITSARPLEPATKKNITRVFGGTVELTEEVDESLIGGFIAKTRDMIMDVSIKGRLNQLKLFLSK